MANNEIALRKIWKIKSPKKIVPIQLSQSQQHKLLI